VCVCVCVCVCVYIYIIYLSIYIYMYIAFAFVYACVCVRESWGGWLRCCGLDLKALKHVQTRTCLHAKARPYVHPHPLLKCLACFRTPGTALRGPPASYSCGFQALDLKSPFSQVPMIVVYLFEIFGALF